MLGRAPSRILLNPMARRPTTMLSTTLRPVALSVLMICAALAGWLLHPGAQGSLAVGQPAPEITGGPWINSEPLSLSRLGHRVVLVEFWTYG
jgi:hypothetical protein